MTSPTKSFPAWIAVGLLSLTGCGDGTTSPAAHAAGNRPNTMTASVTDVTSGRQDPDDSTGTQDVDDRVTAEDLLRLAYRGASKFPLDPHVKNRSRVQHEIVSAALELGRPDLAHDLLRGIRNWRKGMSHAELAYHYAKAGDREKAELHIEYANQIADNVALDANPQPWRRDKVRATVAATYAVLGDTEAQAKTSVGLQDAAVEPLAIEHARRMPDDEFDAEIERIDVVLKRADFDLVRATKAKCVEFYDRFFADASRRAALETRVLENDAKRVKLDILIEFHMDLIEVALRHRGFGEAHRLIDKTQTLIDHSGTWLPEHILPIKARLATLRFEAGDKKAALAHLDAALDWYDDEGRESTYDVFRASALRPVAEAFHAIGEKAKALELYERVVEEGDANPNSRPKAVDLAATCCSMAVHGVEPGAELFARMKAICDGLGQPW